MITPRRAPRRYRRLGGAASVEAILYDGGIDSARAINDWLGGCVTHSADERRLEITSGDVTFGVGADVYILRHVAANLIYPAPACAFRGPRPIYEEIDS